MTAHKTMHSKSFILQIGVAAFAIFAVPRMAGPLLPPPEPGLASETLAANQMAAPSHLSRFVIGANTANLDAEEKEIVAGLPKVEVVYNSHIDKIADPTAAVINNFARAKDSVRNDIDAAVYKAVANQRRLSDWTWLVNGLLFVIPCCFYLFDREIDSFRFLNISTSVSWLWLQCLCWTVSALFLLLRCDLWENLPATVWLVPAAIWAGGTALTWSIQKGIRGSEIKVPTVKPVQSRARRLMEKVKHEIFHMMRA